jgi:DNA-binding MarR family transcriptional regulator
MISSTTDNQTVAESLRPILLRLARELRKETEQFGVTATQATLLALIDRNADITASELAAEEAVSQPSMTRHLDRLERLGLVQRVRSTEDRRRVGLSLTPVGARTLRRIRARRTTWLADRLGGLTRDELASIDAALPALMRLTGGPA